MLPNQRHFFGFFTGVGGGWPFGVDGDLYIPNATTITLNPGDVKDYNSITIDAGGKLNISAGTSDWVILGCKGNCIINGTIEGILGEHIGDTFNATAPDDMVLSHTIVQRAGGSGGGTANGYPGGAQNFGNGGGGATDGINGLTATLTAGANGHGSSTGGAIYGNSGQPQVSGLTGSGGGGARHRHGQNIYLRVNGIISGSGTINVSGSNGGAGAYGGGCIGKTCYGTGGGGGGAGGSAGKIVVRYKSGLYGLTNQVSGGLGGPGGPGGSANYASNYGYPGAGGQTGDLGSVDIALI